MDSSDSTRFSSYLGKLPKYTGRKDEDRPKFVQDFVVLCETVRRLHESSIRQKIRSVAGEDNQLIASPAYSWWCESFEEEGLAPAAKVVILTSYRKCSAGTSIDSEQKKPLGSSAPDDVHLIAGALVVSAPATDPAPDPANKGKPREAALLELSSSGPDDEVGRTGTAGEEVGGLLASCQQIRQQIRPQQKGKNEKSNGASKCQAPSGIGGASTSKGIIRQCIRSWSVLH
ncbi:hypothetical protein CYMTET_15621 [Cymbomonas tetramitiformis]|uniref:Uncharacterized protein n=1 Tax=Cymbomonas tetramitiformis TaxID=36881 RepID=A0AAE0GE06_9CHLO|nr:hypothetical protein CYMTET_15621 [Cymbomonas tetramitiformis]